MTDGPTAARDGLRPGDAGSVYTMQAFAAMPRLLSLLDRDPLSRTFGSFDRDHWAWKFRDFPLTMLQLSAIPLATLWRHDMPGNRWYANDHVRTWTEAALEELCQRQRRNGAFDSVGPFTQDHGVTLAAVYILTESLRILGDAAPDPLRARIADSVDLACRFARRSREDYAFISNHHALFAVSWQGAASLLGDAALQRQADAVIDQILAHQSTDGWYLEYDGPDPGYESLGIGYLAKYWQRSGSAALLESLRRATEFHSHCVHPDGSIGGLYGSRLTRLYFPSGFEILAPHLPAAAAVAGFMRGRLQHGNVVTLANVDTHNLAPLLLSYLDAAREAAPLADSPAAPCETLHGLRCFDAATLCVAGTQHYYALVSSRSGAACLLFDRRTGKLVFEDGGYMVRRRGRRHVTQGGGAGRSERVGDGREIACEVPLNEVRQEVLTPGRFVLLRILNLTVFRSLWLGSLVRRLVIGRLITGERGSAYQLRRQVEFGEDAVRIRDRLEGPGGSVEAVEGIRSSPGMHMGSARYHHSSELEAGPDLRTGDMRSSLDSGGVAMREMRIGFGGETPIVEVVAVGVPDEPREMAVDQ